MSRFFIPRIAAASAAVSCSRRRIANKAIIRINNPLQLQLRQSRSISSSSILCRHDSPDSNSNSNANANAGRIMQVRVRNYHHSGGPSLYHGSIADDDFPPSTNNSTAVPAPGSKAFILESDRHALVDLFKKHATPEHPRSLDRQALALVLKAVGETPDEETLEQIFQDADLDGNGVIDLNEFLTTSDKILGSAPAGMVLLVGGPGSGKGVLSKRLVEECGVVHISSGDLLREEVSRDTPLGREVSEIMSRGDLVSSAVIVTLMRRVMRRPEHAGKRILLDGFPRSLQNATDLVELCGQPELALHLQCDGKKKRKEKKISGLFVTYSIPFLAASQPASRKSI